MTTYFSHDVLMCVIVKDAFERFDRVNVSSSEKGPSSWVGFYIEPNRGHSAKQQLKGPHGSNRVVCTSTTEIF